jgi:transcriptional regulator with PAS, ATPase and Fis domain
MPSRRRREPRLRDFFRTRNAAMRDLLATVEKVTGHDVSILILGESGSGKDYLAEAVHACSPRRDEPFVHIDCASIPADLFESELFGYEKGTFTDATARKSGRLEAARRGTVYFDEIAALTPPLQAKLLRAIQEKRFTRLGGNQPVLFDARVISSSNADPDALLASGALRRDLYYRINVVTIALPPLRDRQEDIAAMAEALAGEKTIDAGAMKQLVAYSWPGNVRELRNVIERAVLLANGDAIVTADLPPLPAAELVDVAARGRWTLEELESRYINEVLRQTRSNFSRAAEILGINRKTLLEKRRKYGIE